MGLSFTEILVVFIVILLLFGAKKLPELARSLGRASYEFKKAKDDIIRESNELADAAAKAAEIDAARGQTEKIDAQTAKTDARDSK